MNWTTSSTVQVWKPSETVTTFLASRQRLILIPYVRASIAQLNMLPRLFAAVVSGAWEVGLHLAIARHHDVGYVHPRVGAVPYWPLRPWL
jgi:hypothetical protein